MTTRTKYPRTFHLPWSESVHSDDKMVDGLSSFKGMNVVATVKMDGESTSMYSDAMHARSIDSAHNFTRDWAKKLHSVLRFDIPEGWIFSFENVAYFHSIEYDDLESFCYLLSIWNEKGFCLPYREQRQWAEILDLAMPKVLYEGPFDENVLKNVAKSMDLDKDEGYVIRNVESFHRDDFQRNVAKFVRKGHVQARSSNDDEPEHWLKNTYPNRLADPKNVKPAYMAQFDKKAKP